MRTTRGTRARRGVAWLAAAVVAGVVTLVGPAAPAAAAACDPGSQSEVHSGFPLEVGCDDVTPPETTMTSVSPEVSSQGYVSSKNVTFTFTGAYTDAEANASPAHPIGLECQLYNTVTAPAAWQSCDSGTFTTPVLDESTSVPYTFRVRAFDVQDRAIVACDDDFTDGCPSLAPGEEVVPDEDPSPATRTFKVDTTAPNTFITRGPVDSIRPDWPVTTTASPQLALNSNESGSYQCTLNGKPVACADGMMTLRDLSPGSKTFEARAVDAAGNTDPTPATLKFFVPANIKNSKRSDWKRVKAGGYFGGDYLEARTVGATLRIKGQRNVREVRLLAPAGPKLGKLEVRVGRSQWYTVDLHSKSAVRQKVYLVRNEFTPLQDGTIQIRVKKLRPGWSVVVDALVARN
jgi:hypothetical protein